MNPCISQVTTLSTPFEADLPAYSAAGWRFVEIWLTKLETFLETHSVAEARTLLADHELEAPGASVQGGLLLSRGEARKVHWELYRRRLDILSELGVKTLVVAADFDADPVAEDFPRASDSLAEAAELARPLGVTLALEFRKTAKFCASLDTTLALIAQSGASGVGVCLDLFHYYTGPSKFEDLGYLDADNLAWLQVCDLSGVPRELARDADRVLPGDGDFRLGPIFDHLRAIGYEGYVSLEVLNPMMWSIAPMAVADAGLRALDRVLYPEPAAPRGRS